MTSIQNQNEPAWDLSWLICLFCFDSFQCFFLVWGKIVAFRDFIYIYFFKLVPNVIKVCTVVHSRKSLSYVKGCLKSWSEIIFSCPSRYNVLKTILVNLIYWPEWQTHQRLIHSLIQTVYFSYENHGAGTFFFFFCLMQQYDLFWKTSCRYSIWHCTVFYISFMINRWTSNNKLWKCLDFKV